MHACVFMPVDANVNVLIEAGCEPTLREEAGYVISSKRAKYWYCFASQPQWMCPAAASSAAAHQQSASSR